MAARFLPISRILPPLFVATVAMAALAALAGCGRTERGASVSSAATPAPTSDRCIACHKDIYAGWRPSHHAWANRKFDPLFDGPAFDPAQSVTIGTVTSTASVEKGAHTLRTLGPGGTVQPFRPDMVLAHTPLRQMLIPFPGGRWQATELAVDPVKNEWFNVYGDENRRADEWGAWMNRGMNWNSNCAFCHMTDFKKGYDISSDSYRSTWTEMGVSCAQCHGAMPGHIDYHEAVAAGKKPPGPIPSPHKLTPEMQMNNCASCHSRREELDGNFKAGELYTDHFRITLPESPRMYYPDGQILDEVFVYASFKLSKMAHKGLTCANCHDPHSGKTLMPAGDNTLCMACHQVGTMGAPYIDPVAHGHHAPGSKGNSCIECHMSFTTYMQRDPRRDHGFISPDPLLTKELGIPNSCNKCHTDQTVDWAIEWADKWYGAKLERPERTRTRTIARAQRGDASAAPELATLARKEPIALWRATLLAVAAPWIGSDPQVLSLGRDLLRDPDPDVRSTAVRTLTQIPGEIPALRPLLDDPSRLVRVDAAWALKENLGDRPKVREELLAYLHNSADQPSGAARLGQYAFSQGDHALALSWYRKALEWDKFSPALYSDMAMIQNTAGQQRAALDTLSLGRTNIPTEPQFPYMMGLLHAELGEPERAEEGFRDATRLEPNFARAWYNLGLLLAGQERLDDAAAHLAKAADAEPRNPDYPFALATVEIRRGDREAARAAAGRALAIDPGHQGANALLRSLEGPPPR